MTRVTKQSPWRETAALQRDGSRTRLICVANEPLGLVLRLKGTRRKMRLPWARLYVLAAMAEAQAKVATKRTRRNVRRGILIGGAR